MIIIFIWLIYMKEIVFKWIMYVNFINKDIKKNNIKKYEEDKRVFKNWEILRWSKKRLSFFRDMYKVIIKMIV